jgi:simple sugar transport system substrate-binding protein
MDMIKTSLRGIRWTMTLVGGVVLAGAAAGSAQAQDEELSIYFVGCAAPAGFHGYLARGAEEAGQNLGVRVTYIYPDRLTIPDQVRKIEEAIAAQADGIAVCAFAEDSAYEEVAARAADAGIAFGSAAGPRPTLWCGTPMTSSCSARDLTSERRAASPPTGFCPWV